MRPVDSGDSWSAKTNFETKTHEELHAMVAGANPQGVLAVGTALSDASTHIQSIADDLAHHITGLAWDSEAGHTFKGWAQQVISATDTLATYANNTGVAINMAGETLSSVKPGMPPVPVADMAMVAAFKQQHVLDSSTVIDLHGKVLPPGLTIAPTTLGPTNGVSQAQAYQAQTRIDAAHQEAIGQMEKLGGSYVGANSTLGVSTIPNFPPTPTALMPPPGSGIDGSGNTTGVSGGSSSSGGGGGGYGTVRTTSGGKSSSGGSGSHSGGIGIAFVPVHSPAPGSGGSGISGGGTTTLQGTHSPTAPGLPAGSSGSGSTATGGGSTGGGPVAPPLAGGGAGRGGSGGTTLPGEGSGTSRGGRKGLGGTVEPGAGRNPGGVETGIHGGVGGARVGGSRLGAGAIGAGAGGFGRGSGIGGSGAVHAGSSGSSVEGSGSSSARSGVSAEVGAGGGSAAAGERSGSSGMMPGGGGMGSGGRRGTGRGGRRPGYLVEDEETWASGGVQANPAVIE